MKAQLRYHSKVTLVHRSGENSAVAELKVWYIGTSKHYPEGIKYTLFLVKPENGTVILGMDNHKPKGPHLHLNGQEIAYSFTTIDELITDFWRLAAEKGFIP
jgi:hypothetical protein